MAIRHIFSFDVIRGVPTTPEDSSLPALFSPVAADFQSRISSALVTIPTVCHRRSYGGANPCDLDDQTEDGAIERRIESLG